MAGEGQVAEQVLYDDTNEPVQQPGAFSVKNQTTIGFTFQTGAQGGTLADVQLGIIDYTPNDSGDVQISFAKYDGFATKFVDNPVQLATLSDTMFSASTTPTDIPISQTITLAPNTTYVIEATGLGNSAAEITNEFGNPGQGVAGQQNIILGSAGGGAGANYEDGAIVARVTENATCFVTGTRIRTVYGECKVEELRVGDLAATASGRVRPIIWIGHRTIDRPKPSLRPVRICAGAFGAGLPERDLLLSAGHPVLIGAGDDGEGGHLSPIMCLINGTTIDRVPADKVTYWHIELEAHDILLAEGLPVESYLDWGDRAFFTGGADDLLGNPDHVVPGLAGRCRPVAINGLIVEDERRRLNMVFEMRLAAAAGWPDAEERLWL